MEVCWEVAADVWEGGEAYERFMGRWSRLVADEFLAWLEIPAGAAWLDVGCGTGALLERILERRDPTRLVGIDPAQTFLDSAEERLGGRAELHVADAGQLPFGDGEFDCVVSGLVLNFLPDPAAAVGEMRRVATPGGAVAAYVWDYAEGMGFLRSFWDAAVALDPNARPLDEGGRFPLNRPGPLEDLLGGAGLTGVKVRAIEVPTRFAGFEDYWAPFVGGPGPAPGYVNALGEAERERLREHLRRSLPVGPEGTIELIARAWAVKGDVPSD